MHSSQCPRHRHTFTFTFRLYLPMLLLMVAFNGRYLWKPFHLTVHRLPPTFIDVDNTTPPMKRVLNTSGNAS
jgi:hypothetical protein